MTVSDRFARVAKRLRANYVLQRWRDQQALVAVYLAAVKQVEAKHAAELENARASVSVALREVARTRAFAEPLPGHSVRVCAYMDLHVRLLGEPPYRIVPEVGYWLLRDLERALQRIDTGQVTKALRGTP